MDHSKTGLVIPSGDLMPDSRAREAKGVVRGDMGYGSMNWVRVFCANCGTPYGYVPEDFCTFSCWLCTPCSDKWGDQFNTLMSPDVAMWGKIEAAMLEKFGRVLSSQEIAMLAEASNDPLSKLLREGK